MVRPLKAMEKRLPAQNFSQVFTFFNLLCLMIQIAWKILYMFYITLKKIDALKLDKSVILGNKNHPTKWLI